jgi:hypothetical protein
LIDKCHWVIDEVKEIAVFYKTDCFNTFVTTMMKRRIESIRENNTGYGNYCKLMMNSSYGYDILNEEKLNKTKLCDQKHAVMSQGRLNFLETNQIGENLYKVNYKPTTFKCSTCIQEGFYTLDNAKFAYANFYYEFMDRCLDRERFHYIEGDTDSMYFAIAGNPRGDIHQGFKAIIKDRPYYHKHFYNWFPNPDYGLEDEKKLGGVAIEKEGDEMIAIAPKCYYIRANGKNKLKIKGCSLGKNKQITSSNYKASVFNNEVTMATNVGLHNKKDGMKKESVNKTAISGLHTKMIVLKNNSCAPYIKGINASHYSCI